MNARQPRRRAPREELPRTLQARIDRTWQETIDDSFSSRQVAKLLGLRLSAVRRWRRQGALYGFRDGCRWRYACWQFTVDGTIPALAEVVAAIPEDLHPVVVRGYMTTPQPGLRLKSDAATPRAWILAGCDIELALSYFCGQFEE